MKRNLILTLAVLLCAPLAMHASVGDVFSFDGIYYKVLGEGEGGGTVRVITPTNNKKYSGDLTVPDCIIRERKTWTVTAMDWSSIDNNNITSIDLQFKPGYDTATVPAYLGGSVAPTNPKLTSLKLSEGFKKLGDNALSGQKLLTTFEMPGMTEVGSSAFKGCTSLVTLRFNANVTVMGDNVCEGCTALTYVTMPMKYQFNAHSNMFKGCTSLMSISDPMPTKEKVASYTWGMSYDTSKGIYLYVPADQVEELNGYSFDISNSQTAPYKIEPLQFTWNDYLNYRIESTQGDEMVAALSKCYITWTDEITAVAEKVEYNGVEFVVRGIGKEAFRGCQITSMTLPESIRWIDQAAFYECENLKNLSILSKDIEVRLQAFAYCTSLELVRFPGKCSLGIYCFVHCTNLNSFIGREMTAAPGEYAFMNCSGLVSAYIGGDFESLADNTFYGCTSLNTLGVICPEPPHALDAFPGVDISKVTLIVPPEPIRRYYNSTPFGDFGEIISTSWLNDEGTLYYRSFINHGHADMILYSVHDTGNVPEEIILPASMNRFGMYMELLAIGDRAFSYISQLKKIEIPNTVKEIGIGAFERTSLSEVTLPENLTSIGSKAFSYCTKLKKVNCYMHDPTTIECGQNVFTGIDSKCVLYVPADAVELYKATAPWSSFYDIKPLGSDGIVDIDNDDDNDGNAVWYNMQGIKVNLNNLTPGFYIRNGRKVVVK